MTIGTQSIYRALMLANYSLGSASLYTEGPLVHIGDGRGLSSIAVARGVISGAASGVAGLSPVKYGLLNVSYQALEIALYEAFPGIMGQDRRTMATRGLELGIGLLGVIVGKSMRGGA